MSHVDETLLGLRSGGRLRLTCSRSLTVWSSVPAFLKPHYDGNLKAALDVGLHLGCALLDANEYDASFDSLIEKIGVGPSITAFAMLPANPNEFLACLGALII